MHYAYITGCAMLFSFWLLVFWARKDLRKEMVWASMWGMPFGLVELLLVPVYWNPDSLFGLIKKYGVGIESFIFLFTVAGLASVLYQFFQKKQRPKPMQGEHVHFWLLIFVVLAFVTLSVIFPVRVIYNLMIAGAAGAAIIAYLRRDLWKQICASAFIFSFFYFGIFVAVNSLFRGFIEQAYTLENTWGILIVGIPLEEIAVVFFVGAFWSVVYEYANNQRN